jgi:hypothetical protein
MRQKTEHKPCNSYWPHLWLLNCICTYWKGGVQDILFPKYYLEEGIEEINQEEESNNDNMPKLLDINHDNGNSSYEEDRWKK